jgi:hypothetical protein
MQAKASEMQANPSFHRANARAAQSGEFKRWALQTV